MTTHDTDALGGLEDCPFCGGTPILDNLADNRSGKYDWWVRCSICEVQQILTTKGMAVAAWNRRPSLQASGVAPKWSAEATVTAWQHVFEAIEAHILDRMAMKDPVNPQMYLEIIRAEVAEVMRHSEQIVAARWADSKRYQDEIDHLRRPSPQEGVGLEGAPVAQALPLAADPGGGNMDGAKMVLAALRGSVAWHTEQGRPYSASVDEDAIAEIERLHIRLGQLRSLSDMMAEDAGLWFVAQTAAEAYLQQEVRKLCALIEASP